MCRRAGTEQHGTDLGAAPGSARSRRVARDRSRDLSEATSQMRTGPCDGDGNDMLITSTPGTTASGPGRPGERLCCDPAKSTDLVTGPGFKSLSYYVRVERQCPL